VNRTLCLVAISALLVGCNLLLGTEPPIIREPGDGGAGGMAVVSSVGTGGIDDPVSFAVGSGGDDPGADGGALAACGDNSWAHWPPGVAHEYQVSTGSKLERYVVDTLTHLGWQGEASKVAVSWSEAVDHCKLLKWADRTGWRLPTRVELLSIVDYSTLFAPSIDTSLFLAAEPDQYWTSSPSMYVPEPGGSAFWRVNFADGGSFPGMIGSDVGKVRCVRGGIPPAAGGGSETCHRYDYTEMTTKDVETGLTWERTASDPLLRSHAAARCADLQIAGATWRLPTIAELASIVDVEKAEAPRLDPLAFPPVLNQGDWTWSSTSGAMKPSVAWTVRILDGTVSELASSELASVRCVH
jgi:uncharacterized protein DUF1566